MEITQGAEGIFYDFNVLFGKLTQWGECGNARTDLAGSVGHSPHDVASMGKFFAEACEWGACENGENELAACGFSEFSINLGKLLRLAG